MLNTMIAPLLVTLMPFLLGSPTAEPREPQDQDALVIHGDNLTLGELLGIAREQLGIECFLGPAAEDMGDSVSFDGSITLVAAEFLPFFERLLRNHDYLHMETQAGRTPVHHVLRVGARGGRAPANLKALAAVVTPEQARTMGRRDTLITTTYSCRHLPARDAVNTLQPYFADNFTDNIRNIEGTPFIIMTGYSSTLAGVLGLLDEIDVEPPEDAPVPFHPRRVQKLEQEVQALSARVKTLESSR